MLEREQILAEWQDFCAGRKTFDDAHFYTLFHEGRTLEELKLIFSPFSSATDLLNQMVRLFEPNDTTTPFTQYPLPENRMSQPDLEKLVEKDIVQIARLCQQLGEPDLAEELKILPIVPVEAGAADVNLESEFSTTIDDLIGDYFIDARADFDPNTNALFEALYGLVANENLANFLGAPLIKADYNFDYRFLIWKGSGNYIISEEGILVGIIQ